METLAKRPYFKEIAHYHCELAQGSLLRSQFDEGRRYIDLALAEYKLCTRATILLGDLEAQQGNDAAAIAAWQRIESQNPAFLGLVADRLADAYRRTGDLAQGIRVLRNYEDQYPSLDLLTTLFNQILAHEGAEAGTQLIKDELSRNPTLLGLDKLLEAQLMDAPAERRHDLELVKKLVSPAHQAAGHVSLRAMRLSRQAVLLALPGLRQMGNVFAAADRDAGWIRVSATLVGPWASARWPRCTGMAMAFDRGRKT